MTEEQLKRANELDNQAKRSAVALEWVERTKHNDTNLVTAYQRLSGDAKTLTLTLIATLAQIEHEEAKHLLAMFPQEVSTDKLRAGRAALLESWWEDRESCGAFKRAEEREAEEVNLCAEAPRPLTLAEAAKFAVDTWMHKEATGQDFERSIATLSAALNRVEGEGQ